MLVSKTPPLQHVTRQMLQFGSAKRTVACQSQRESCSAVPTCVGLYLPGDGPAHFCRGHLQEAGGGRATLGSPVHLGKAGSPQLHDALVGQNHHLVLHMPVEQLINMVLPCVCAWHHESQLSMQTAAACTRTMHWYNIHKEQQVTGSMLLVAI